MHKNPDPQSAFTLTIKNANDGGDVRIGIDEGDSWENLISFIRANKNDFDDLRDDHLRKQHYLYYFNLLKYNGEKFDATCFNKLLERPPPQNIDVMLFGHLSPTQVDFNGKIYDIFCKPTFYYIKSEIV